MVCPSLVKSSSKTPSRTWAPSSSRRSQPRPTTSLVTAPPPLPCSHRPSSRKACATWPLAPTQWVSSAASRRPSLQPLKPSPSRPVQVDDSRARSLRSRRSQPLTRPWARSSPTPSTRSAKTVWSPSKSRTPSAWSSTSSRACSSTRATSRRTSSPTQSARKQSSTMPTSCSTRARSARFRTSFRSSRRSCRPASRS